MTNSELLKKLKRAVALEKKATIFVLRYLREVQERLLHLEEGYNSLFAFCTGALGYSEDQAQYRILALKLILKMPSTEELISSGEISLTVAAMAQVAFRRNEFRADVVSRLRGLSSRAAERLLAAEFPSPPPRERTRAVTGELTEIKFVADTVLMGQLERLKELLAHKNFAGRYDLLFKEIAEMALRKLEGRQNSPVAPQVKRTRYIPVRTRRELMKNSCEFVSPAGKRCGSRHGVQVDHIVEFGMGGGNERENLRALCGAHNRYVYVKGRPS
jgi:hypothetical protein